MKKMNEAWGAIYGDKTLSAQTLRDYAIRFRRNSLLLNLIEVRDGSDVEPEMRDIIPNNQNRNEYNATASESDSKTECDMTNEE